MMIAFLVLFIVVCTFVIVRAPKLTLTLWKRYMVRTIAAVLLIVCVNIIGNNFGIHIPINIFTVLLTSLLGLPGLFTVIGLQFLFL